MELQERFKGRVETASKMASLQSPLPVLPALSGLIPGLRRGSTVQVSGLGATSLGLSLVAQASIEGTWIAAAGLSGIGLLAAGELGVVLDRVVLVPDPRESWPDVLAALVDAFDLVLVHASARTAAGARKIAPRVRERGCVLVVVGPWESADVRVRGAVARWHGLEDGHGRLRARELDVVVEGRGAAARTRRVTLWLPDAEGRVTPAAESDVWRSTPQVVAIGG